MPLLKDKNVVIHRAGGALGQTLASVFARKRASEARSLSVRMNEDV
jgi:hypothetical protein